MNARSDGADGDREYFGDLGVSELLPRVQQQGLDLIDGLKLQNRCHGSEVVLCISSRSDLNCEFGPVAYLPGQPSGIGEILSSRASQRFADEVVGDPEEPRPSVVMFEIEASAILERPPEDVASDVLPASDPDPTDAESDDPIKVTVEDLAERLRFAYRLLDDLRIVHIHH